MPNLDEKIKALQDEHQKIYLSINPQLTRMTFLEGQIQALSDLKADDLAGQKAAADALEEEKKKASASEALEALARSNGVAQPVG